VEDISNSLEDLGVNVINVRQMTATQTAPSGQTHVELLPLFIVILTRNINSQEIFKLNSLNHIIIKAVLYRAQTGLMQCCNCQNFCYVWANCKQPPQCLWCVGGHLHRECPSSRGRETSSIITLRLQTCKRRTAKEKSTTSFQGIV
jgi:hypothetical protein